MCLCARFCPRTKIHSSPACSNFFCFYQPRSICCLQLNQMQKSQRLFCSFAHLYSFHSQIVHATKTLVYHLSSCFVILLIHVSVFQLQLQALMETLNSTEPHYVRCVKPNSANRPQIFENQSVLHQLRCGVMTFTEA